MLDAVLLALGLAGEPSQEELEERYLALGVCMYHLEGQVTDDQFAEFEALYEETVTALREYRRVPSPDTKDKKIPSPTINGEKFEQIDIIEVALGIGDSYRRFRESCLDFVS